MSLGIFAGYVFCTWGYGRRKVENLQDLWGMVGVDISATVGEGATIFAKKTLAIAPTMSEGKRVKHI